MNAANGSAETSARRELNELNEADELDRGFVIVFGWKAGWGGAGSVCRASPLAGVGPLAR